MLQRNTDQDWEKLGELDPYYAVVTSTEFHREGLSEERKAAFFALGRAYVETIFERIDRHIAPGFAPRRALDFGCGVGRITLPLARKIETVIGADVAGSMLAEAQKNAAEQDVVNVAWVLSDDTLSQVHGTFDLVHSFIVFQHIPPAKGMRILHGLLERVEPEGVAVIHVTYGKRGNPLRKGITWARKQIPFVHNLLNLVQRKPLRYPAIQMHAYDLNAVSRLFQESGFLSTHLEWTDHKGNLGVILFAQRLATPGTTARPFDFS
jgi:2-polyprenyl-3-methyl-5-hydroxy-6-metoxy-1,4-benzoquinol methylase